MSFHPNFANRSRRRRPPIGARLAFVGCLAAVVAGTLATVPSGSYANPENAASVSAAAEADLSEAEQYAERHSVGVSEAENRLSKLHENAGQLDVASKTAGAALARARFVHDPDLAIVVSVTTESSARAVADALTGATIPVRVQVVAKSLRDLEAYTDERIGSWLAKYPEVKGVDIDGEHARITLDVEGDAELQRSIVEDLGTRAEVDGFSLVVKGTASGAIGDGRRGGLDMQGCTVGFSIRRVTDGQLGIATAGHCTNAGQQWRNINQGPWENAFFIGEQRNAFSDLQWHTIASTPQPYFFTTTTNARPVDGTFAREEMDGMSICHRGSRTGYSCGTVTSISYRPTYANACPGTTCDAAFIQAAGSTLRCARGDSGGPWFLGNTAAGIYKGQDNGTDGTTAADCDSAWFTPVRRLSTMGAGFAVMIHS